MTKTKCAKCETSPWAVPRNPTPQSVVAKVCCGRTSTYDEVTRK